MEYVGAHVKALEREIHQSINFLSTESILAARGLEAFEADNKDARHTVNLERFSRLNKILTPVTVPLVVFVERLRLLKVVKAMV